MGIKIPKIAQAARLGLAAGLGFLSCLLFVVVRFGLTGHFMQGYLIWNLFLAIIPAGIASLGNEYANRLAVIGKKPSSSIVLGIFFVWLIFYPNSPYIFTDFIHVVRRAGLGRLTASWLSEYDLLWYDIVMNSAFAFTGHYFGLVSTYTIHAVMSRQYGRLSGWLMLLPPIILSGFGIHLGRFSRFNSWDLVLHPIATSKIIMRSLKAPAALLFSMAFSLFIALSYIVFYLLKNDASAKRAE